VSASANPAATTEQSSLRWRWAKAVASIGSRLIAPPSTRSSTAASASVDGRLDSSSRCRIDAIATSSSSSAAKL
jgi:hypothetical protein